MGRHHQHLGVPLTKPKPSSPKEEGGREGEIYLQNKSASERIAAKQTRREKDWWASAEDPAGLSDRVRDRQRGAVIVGFIVLTMPVKATSILAGL